MDRDSCLNPPSKKLKISGPSSNYSASESLFKDIGAPGSEYQSSNSTDNNRSNAMMAADDGFFTGHLIDGLLSLGRGTPRIKQALEVFSPAFNMLQVGIISALQYKDKDPAPLSSELSDNEYLALRYYLSPEYYKPINQHLRGVEIFSPIERVVEYIKAALLKLEHPASRKSFRAIKRKYAPKLGVFESSTFISASESAEKANIFMKNIYGVGEGPEKSLVVIFGLDARRVGSGIDEGENGLREVIYQPHIKFNVILRGQSIKTGTDMVVMEQVNHIEAGRSERLIEALALQSFGVHTSNVFRMS